MPHLTQAPANPPRTAPIPRSLATHAPVQPPHPRLAVPGLAHPRTDPAQWAVLTGSAAPVHWTVLNVANGPGTRPDPYCLEAVAMIRSTGAMVIGHLDLRHGAGAFADLVAGAHRYLEWYETDGFLLDRCPTDRGALSEVRRTVTAIRTLADRTHMVLGHGAYPHPGYAETADQLVTFSGPWSGYRWSQAPGWTAEYSAQRFCHLVHGLPRGHLDQALRIARWQGAATVCFTDRTRQRRGDSPWRAMPGYWDEIVSLVGRGVSE